MERPLTLRGLDLHEHLLDPKRKQRYVTTVFEIVASSYDRFTRLSSLGMDMAWKRELLGLVKPHLSRSSDILDLATGTGDLAFALAAFAHDGHVVGLDIAAEMIQRADDIRRRRHVHNARFVHGDMMELPFADASMDAVTVSYGLRNVPDFHAALAEISRVLRPGGVLASLDFVRPEFVLWEKLFLHSLKLTCNFFGWLWHREPAVYGYLADSIAGFVTMKQLEQALTAAGFTVLDRRLKFTGMIGIVLAEKNA